MAALTAAVVLVGILCVLDLLLTIGVIKKLREYGPGGPMGAPGKGMTPLRPGEELPAFTAVAEDGARVSPSSLPDGWSLIAFLSPNCAPCRTKLPELVAYAAAEPGGRDRTLAVVVGEPGECERFVRELSPVARVVVEPKGGPVCAALRVDAFPTTLRVHSDQGRTVVTGHVVDLAREASPR
ncbi:redoxin domain-containing protein [Streptomyces sp. TRM S81-3]|uniref:Redoxin domain-containing protein n=1 Tax=Streptomyces griseicoloratus TaxID=2752516 RepID=A0A926KW71_9ACTN|nr:redoxin domain-containing protein [Streptomyces griseicoloratus]MBD0417977.1 redoxin domain-containing protein [Streptomyces griseicoloratus]